MVLRGIVTNAVLEVEIIFTYLRLLRSIQIMVSMFGTIKQPLVTLGITQPLST